ncbi:sulfotransferase [Shimia gijangensis]
MTTTSCCDPQKRPRFWLEFSAGFSLAGQEWAAMVPDMAPEQVLEVKYETLIEEPEETLNKICLFLDVQFQPSVLEYDQNSTYSKPDAALTYQWRRKLTPER